MEFATYTFVPSGVTATPIGKSNPLAFTVAVTMLFVVLITETVLLSEFVIYANGAALAILTNIEIIAAEMKAIEYNLRLLIMYFTSFSILLVSKIRRLFCEM